MVLSLSEILVQLIRNVEFLLEPAEITQIKLRLDVMMRRGCGLREEVWIQPCIYIL